MRAALCVSRLICNYYRSGASRTDRYDKRHSRGIDVFQNFCSETKNFGTLWTIDYPSPKSIPRTVLTKASITIDERFYTVRSTLLDDVITHCPESEISSVHLISNQGSRRKRVNDISRACTARSGLIDREVEEVGGEGHDHDHRGGIQKENLWMNLISFQFHYLHSRRCQSDKRRAKKNKTSNQDISISKKWAARRSGTVRGLD